MNFLSFTFIQFIALFGIIACVDNHHESLAVLLGIALHLLGYVEGQIRREAA